MHHWVHLLFLAGAMEYYQLRSYTYAVLTTYLMPDRNVKGVKGPPSFLRSPAKWKGRGMSATIYENANPNALGT